MSKDKIKAWHFIKDDYRMQYSDELVEVGKTYIFDGEPILCRQGYHASVRAIDALSYSPGNVICQVEMGGVIVNGNDKLVATERKVISMTNAEELLREFARWSALEVAHLWDMPPKARQFLETGDESLRLEELVVLANSEDKLCEACETENAWKYAETGLCFSCTTGESDASDDYELVSK